MKTSPISIILDDQEETIQSQTSLLLKAKNIYQQNQISRLSLQNSNLKAQILSLKQHNQTKKNLAQFSQIKSQIMRISGFIEQAEQNRQEKAKKWDDERQVLRTQLENYKQKYNQVVSANLRKTKTLDKNQALANKLDQQNRTLKAQNSKNLQMIQQLKLQISRLEIEKRRHSDLNNNLTKQLQWSKERLSKQQQQCNKLIIDLQNKISDQNAKIYHMSQSLQQAQSQSWTVKRKNAALRQSNSDLCVICLSRTAILLNQSCGHLLSCLQCSGELTRCPICRTQKSRFIRLWRV